MILQTPEPKFRYIVNDLIIKEDNCNLRCEYCLTGQSLFKQEHSKQQIFLPPKRMSIRKGTAAYDRLIAITEITANRQIPIIKVSGGEVMLIDGFIEFIETICPKFKKVVVLTNGLLLTDDILTRFEKAGNIVLQISLDSTRFEGNKYRIQQRRVHDILMRKIDDALTTNIPSEIYCVINKLSVEYLIDTVEYLERYAKCTKFYPFPVRGPDKLTYLPSGPQIDKIKELLLLKNDHEQLLPHRSYLNKLVDFFLNNGRKFVCHLPRVAFSSFDDGSTTNCPNIWFNVAGNFLMENEANVFDKLSSSKFKELLLARIPRLDACKNCFTPWDPVSLFFEDELSLNDLMQIPMYNSSNALSLLAWNKQLYESILNSE